MNGEVEAILIAGPTASGKSALAIRLAERLGGTVINADSMQIYADLRIITARPTAEEERAVPHLLFGHVDAARLHSVAQWLEDARAAVAAVRAAGRIPILTGGTGLYFRALLEGLSDVPRVPDEIRARIRAAAEGRAPEDLHAELAARDPATAARLRPTDPQRILRALEVFEATGRPLSAMQGPRSGAVLDPARAVCIFLAPDRDVLRARIDARFDAMIEGGALDEVRRLAARSLDPALPAMRAHGVPGLVAALRGDTSMEDAIARGKGDTRRYAKRQHTWFRHQAPDFAWVVPEAAEAHILAALASARRGA